jgi:hypothetical protein
MGEAGEAGEAGEMVKIPTGLRHENQDKNAIE